MNQEALPTSVEDEPEQGWIPPKIENEQQLEERLQEHAALELAKTTGQALALKNLAEKYQYMYDEVVAKLEGKQLWLEVEIERFSREKLLADGKKTYTGAFGTVRMRDRKYAHTFTDRKAFIAWAIKEASHLLTSEVKRVDVPDRAMLDHHIKRTGELPPGVEVQEKTGCTITPDTDGLQPDREAP